MIIYKATNKINGKCYIGQTRHSLEHRKTIHLRCAKKGVETHFYQAIRKYGEENFEWEIICSANDKKRLNELETFYIQKYDSIKHGYNMVDGGDNNVMDIESVKTKHDEIMRSAEVRKKISDTMKNKIANGEFFTTEHRRRLSESAKGNHNFGSGDTRSIGCYCVDEFGEKHYFHSYLDAGKWWYKTYRPFPYSACTYQRKIKQSIQYGFCTYGRGCTQQIFYIPEWHNENEEEVIK